MPYSPKPKKINIYYLKMTKAPEIILPTCDKYSLNSIKKPISIDSYLSYYHDIGKAFGWTDRLQISKTQLQQDINKENAHLFTLQVDGKEVGYTELVVEKDYVELLYFGLFTTEIGKGYGEKFLTMILEKAWTFDPQWVQLNTCELDHPKALSLYQKMGFTIVDTKTKPALS